MALLGALDRVKDEALAYDTSIVVTTDEETGQEQVVGRMGRYENMISDDLPHIAVSEWSAHLFGLGLIRPECNVCGGDEFAYRQDMEALSQAISCFLTAA